jgi:hypothetical protein
MYKETFTSPFEKDTEAEAQKVLEAIRSAHSEQHGWREIKGYIEPLPNGKFRAVREHVKE